MPPLSVAFLVYPNVTQLDFTGPAQVLREQRVRAVADRLAAGG